MIIKLLSIFLILLWSFAFFELKAETLSESLIDPVENFNENLQQPRQNSCNLESSNDASNLKTVENDKEKTTTKNNIFFNLQFMVNGKNGESSFQSVYVPRINLGSVIGQHAFFNEIEREDVLKFKPKELRDLLLDSTSSLKGKAKEAAVDNALLIYKLTKIKDEKLMYQTLAREMRSQSFARKVDFIANLLSYLMDNYDFTSIETNNTKAIRVTDMDMLAAIGESIRTGNPVEAGVCRHMHQFAAKMAAAIGIKNPYTVGFVTTQYGHMTLVMEDPKDPTKVIQLNYGSKSENKGVTGPEALSQNHSIPSTGIVFKLFNHKDQHAINLPTELGGVLNRMAGGDDQDLSPDYKSKSQFDQVGVETPYGVVRFFKAESPLGNQEQVQGGAYNVKLKYNDLFYGEFGISGFTSSRPTERGELKNMGLYARTTQGMNLKFYTSPNVDASLFSELNLRGMVLCAAHAGEECKANVDGEANLTSGASLGYKIGDLKNKTSLIFQNQLTPNHAVVTQDLVVDVPVVQLRHDSNFKITSSLDGNLGGEITYYNIGPGRNATYNAHLGLIEHKSKIYFQANVDGRLTNITPIWIPDSEKSVSGVIGTSIFNDSLYLGIDGRKSLEIDGNYYLGIGVGGSIGK